MPAPSHYARTLLIDLLLETGFGTGALQLVLKTLGLPMQVVYGLVDGSPIDAATRNVHHLVQHGVLDARVINAIEAQLPGHAEAFQALRIAMELLPDPETRLAKEDLDRIKHSAMLARLHQPLGFARMTVKLPPEVARRAAQYPTVDSGERQLSAWFDAANRQRIRAGDEVWMIRLLERSIECADDAGKAALRQELERVRFLELGEVSSGQSIADVIHHTGGASVSQGVERIVHAFGISVDAGEFLEGMGRALRRVCLVRVRGSDFGTGFLVGDDLLLTNHHVLAPLLSEMVQPDDVAFVFDYRTVGGTASEGPKVGLATAWRVDDGPPTPTELDQNGEPDLSKDTDPAFLDFALVRLDRPCGRDTRGGGTRGFFAVKGRPAYPFPEGAPLAIVGHPQKAASPTARPQQFAIESNSVIATNSNCTRTRYRTNTFSGSSGSPVLSVPDWEVVALHHYGKAGRYNQGIPLSAIASRPKVDAVLP